MGFNQASIDLWERLGLSQVVAYDGFGGKSGKTDPDCLERNGKTMTLAQAREEDAKEHPNGTLIFVPDVTSAVGGLKPLDLRSPAMALSQNPLQSETVYVVKDGVILSEEDTGRLLANATE
jgi:hypothetical protein